MWLSVWTSLKRKGSRFCSLTNYCLQEAHRFAPSKMLNRSRKYHKYYPHNKTHCVQLTSAHLFPFFHPTVIIREGTIMIIFSLPYCRILLESKFTHSTSVQQRNEREPKKKKKKNFSLVYFIMPFACLPFRLLKKYLILCSLLFFALFVCLWKTHETKRWK